MKKKLVWIASGGTGGHLYPAQSLAEKLIEPPHQIEVLFIGGGLSKNPYFDNNRFSYKQVAAAPFHGISFATFSSCWQMVQGFSESLHWMKQRPPNLIVGFGSYLAAPPLAAGCVKGVPILLHEADSLLGRTNRWFAPFARRVGVVFPQAGAALGKKAICTQMPLRKGYSLAEVSCKEAYAYFGFREDLETLMVIGGSQGADICNQLAEYIQKPCQVLHLSGKKADPENILAVYRKKGISAIVKPFETNMQYAWRVADCWVGRSGSSTLAEALAFEVPGLLIPYPYATGGHQELNARFFCETVGGGLVLPEREISFALFNHHFETLWKDRLLRRAAIQAYKCNGSRPDFVELVWEVLGE